MGQRGSDLLVARVCQRHHGAVQGKRSAMSFGRIGRIDQFAAILEDTVRLLSGYVAHLETRR